MNKSVIKFFDKIIIVLLGVVGLSSIIYSCSDYGMRMTTYEIKGKVTDKKSGKPIQNIQVTKDKMEHLHSGLFSCSGDTLYTNSKGEYTFISYEEFEYPVRLKVEDIDGEKNGEYFVSQEIDVEITSKDRVKLKDGEKYVKKQNFKLEKK
jgi:putative lipoprotein (rSAM/lipoprotein system)